MKQTIENDKVRMIPIMLKVSVILLLINFLWVFVPRETAGKISIYNSIVNGRERLPFGENAERSYNLSLYNLDAMISSHVVSDVRNEDVFRVFLVGDSSIWGFLQQPDQTLAGILNAKIQPEKQVDVFNLGYPSISILKDLQLIDIALQYEPDLIIWFTTLEALPIVRQTSIPLNENNPAQINRLINKYDLNVIEKLEVKLLDRTFWARRRELYDVLRLQLYGFLWNATGIDQDYPDTFQAAMRDFPEPAVEYYGMQEPQELASGLALEIFSRTIKKNPGTDFIVVNEPILISEGENSNLQYNFYYPRWAYNRYREIINNYMLKHDIKYYDFWDLIPESEFTNSAIHLTLKGEELFAVEVQKIIDEHRSEPN